MQCSICVSYHRSAVTEHAVRALQLYLFAVWWLHDSGSVYEFLLEPDGCKATKQMPATSKCQMFNHHMSTYIGFAASSVTEHKARDKR